MTAVAIRSVEDWFASIEPVLRSANDTEVQKAYDERREGAESDRADEGSARRFEVLHAQLTEVAALEAGWNSYDEPSPDLWAVSAANNTLKLARGVTLPNAIVASAEGGVALCWDDALRHAYLEFGNDKTTIIATYRGNEPPDVAEISSDDVGTLGAALEKVRQFFLP